jgi:hypothetical protein
MTPACASPNSIRWYPVVRYGKTVYTDTMID